eukprot:525773-Prorocentrum_minimum.AAC.2
MNETKLHGHVADVVIKSRRQGGGGSYNLVEDTSPARGPAAGRHWCTRPVRPPRPPLVGPVRTGHTRGRSCCSSPRCAACASADNPEHG